MTEEEIKNTQEEELQESEEQQDNTVVNDSVADTEASADTEAPAEEEEEKDPLEQAQAEIEQLKTQILYKTAEFDNYRKRTLKEKAELILNGGEKAVSAILPVIDDMERALANGEKTDDPAVLREGMELIYNKMMKALESLGVKKIETDDADFNTDMHEAVAMVPGMGDDKKGKVIDCLQAGYQLNDKVIRHAKVAVGQ
ncbi:MAG: nucleotide exchange factor GrpE [Prevotella sp.]|jgi:molecular chaperone GrpE|nr:nucleotide exchange factor GrpE [Prevotella sp.]